MGNSIILNNFKLQILLLICEAESWVIRQRYIRLTRISDHTRPHDSVMQMHNRDLDNKPFHQPRIKLETLDESYDDFEFPSYIPMEDYDDPDYMDVKPPKVDDEIF